MVLPVSLRPTRGHVFPFLVAIIPMIWFVYRETPVRVVDGQRVATPLPRTLALAAVSVVASYLVAVIVVTVLVRRDKQLPEWKRLFLRPSRRTLATLGVLLAALTIYAATYSVSSPASTVEVVAVGVLGWPLFVSVVAMYAVGNAVPALQSFFVQATFVVVGLVGSVVWLFVLSTRIAMLRRPGG